MMPWWGGRERRGGWEGGRDGVGEREGGTEWVGGRDGRGGVGGVLKHWVCWYCFNVSVPMSENLQIKKEEIKESL